MSNRNGTSPGFDVNNTFARLALVDDSDADDTSVDQGGGVPLHSPSGNSTSGARTNQAHSGGNNRSGTTIGSERHARNGSSDTATRNAAHNGTSNGHSQPAPFRIPFSAETTSPISPTIIGSPTSPPSDPYTEYTSTHTTPASGPASSSTPNPFARYGPPNRSGDHRTSIYPPSRSSGTPYIGGGIEDAHRSTSTPQAAFRNSRTWHSPETQFQQGHQQDFIVIRNAMRRLFKYSDVAKWKYQDYIAHLEATTKAKQNLARRKLAALEEERRARILQEQTPHSETEYLQTVRRSVDSGLHYEGSLAAVLGVKTIWCMNWMEGKEEVAPWPSFAELKWEGDDRAKTSVGRFLPLPREMGAPGITWAQLQVVEQYELDQVARIPDMEDVYLPVDEIDDEVKYDLITRDLEEAMEQAMEECLET